MWRETGEAWKVVPAEDQEEALDDASGPDEEDQGSFVLGFIAGLIGGCVVLALVLRRGKPKTRTGVYWGFGVQVLLLVIASSRGTWPLRPETQPTASLFERRYSVKNSGNTC